MAASSQGLPYFMEGLRSLGFQPTVLTECPNHVVIDYVVQSGKFCGKEVRLGFIIPPDSQRVPRPVPTCHHISIHLSVMEMGATPPGEYTSSTPRLFKTRLEGSGSIGRVRT